VKAGADWLPKFWWDFFWRGPQKNNKKLSKWKKNCKGAIAAAQTGNSHELRSKKGHDAEGPPIALGAPKLEGPRGIFPTSLYGQSAPEWRGEQKFAYKFVKLT
jgi:hypothetical protein